MNLHNYQKEKSHKYNQKARKISHLFLQSHVFFCSESYFSIGFCINRYVCKIYYGMFFISIDVSTFKFIKFNPKRLFDDNDIIFYLKFSLSRHRFPIVLQ